MAYEHEGHRQRMIEKLKGEPLPDHELLEVFLFPSVPRRNTNDLAHQLLNKFHSMRGVFTASMEELMEIPGVGKSVAANVVTTGLIIQRHFMRSPNAFEGGWMEQDFVAFAIEQYKDFKVEVFDVYLLDERGEVIRRLRYCEFEKAKVAFELMEFSRVIAAEEPARVVLVHNHPTEIAAYSPQDDDATDACQMVCSAHGAELYDHIICGQSGVYSYRHSGRLNLFARKYRTRYPLDEVIE